MGRFLSDKFSHQVNEFDNRRGPGDPCLLGDDWQGAININKLANLLLFLMVRCRKQGNRKITAKVEEHGPEERVSPDVESAQAEQFGRFKESHSPEALIHNLRADPSGLDK